MFKFKTVSIALSFAALVAAPLTFAQDPHDSGQDGSAAQTMGQQQGHSVQPGACPTVDKAKLFDDRPMTEREFRFVPYYKDGKLDSVFVQGCKGDPLLCIGFVEKWEYIVKDTDLKLSAEDAAIVESTLKAKGKYSYLPDATKPAAKRKELNAFDLIAKRIISDGQRLDPGKIEAERYDDGSKEMAIIQGYNVPKPRFGATIGPDTPGNLMWKIPSEENRLDRSILPRLKDSSEMANQIMQAILFTGKQLEDSRSEGDLQRIHQIRMMIKPAHDFLASLRDKHGDEWGRAKDPKSDYAEVDQEFSDWDAPSSAILKLDPLLERIEKITVALDPNQACVLEKKFEVKAPDFAAIKLPAAEKVPEIAAQILVRVGYGSEMKPLDEGSEEVKAGAVSTFKDPKLFAGAKQVLSQLYATGGTEPPFGVKEESTSGGQKFSLDRKAQILQAIPGLAGKVLSFENVRKHLIETGAMDGLQFKLVPYTDNGPKIKLTMEVRKGRKAVGYPREYVISVGEHAEVPFAEMIQDLAPMVGDRKAYYAAEESVTKLREQAQRKEDEVQAAEISRQVEELIQLQRKLGSGGRTGEVSP